PGRLSQLHRDRHPACLGGQDGKAGQPSRRTDVPVDERKVDSGEGGGSEGGGGGQREGNDVVKGAGAGTARSRELDTSLPRPVSGDPEIVCKACGIAPRVIFQDSENFGLADSV